MTAILDPRTTETPEPPWVPTRSEMRRYSALMLGLFVLAVAVQPVADGPAPERPLWALALDTVTTVGLLALVVAAVAGRRWALWAGLATGAPMLVLSVSCPVSGHHEYAAWWGVQLAATAAITVVSAALLRRARAS